MNFKWTPKLYKNNSQFQYKHAISAINQYDFIGNEKILDIGCGDGKITKYISKKAYQGFTLGIDSSERMIDFSKKKYVNCKNLSFEILKAENINFSNNFDLIVSFACLHWVKDKILFLKKSKQSLKKNGKMIFVLYPKHEILWGSIEKISNKNKWKNYFIKYDNPHIDYNAKLYQSICDDLNLNINSISENISMAKFENIIDAKNFIKSWLPHTNQLKKEDIDEYILEILEEISKHYLDKTKIIIPFKKIETIISKNSRC